MTTLIDGRELDPKTMSVLDRPAEERITRVWEIKNEWIPYNRVNQLLDFAEKLLNREPARRLPSMLVYGPPDNGKTALHERFSTLHPIEERPEEDAVFAPVIAVEIESPDVGSFYSAVLRKINAPTNPLDKPQKKLDQLLKVLPKIGTRMILIDELNTAIAGPLQSQKRFLASLKFLANQLRLIYFATGTEDARNALRVDLQFETRFDAFELWAWNDAGEFARLLSSFEYLLPLQKKSELDRPSLAVTLHKLCEGHIGDLAELLMNAAELAIRTNKERIDAEVLKSLGWMGPNARRTSKSGQTKNLAPSVASAAG